LYSKQATCITDFFTSPLTAVCRILGLDMVRAFTWKDRAIRTPGSLVKLSGNILESICTSPTALACSLPIAYLENYKAYAKSS
jgi:hypothetical protein